MKTKPKTVKMYRPNTHPENPRSVYMTEPEPDFANPLDPLFDAAAQAGFARVDEIQRQRQSTKNK